MSSEEEIKCLKAEYQRLNDIHNHLSKEYEILQKENEDLKKKTDYSPKTEIQLSVEMLKEVCDSLPASLLIIDELGDIYYANKFFYNLPGNSAKERNVIASKNSRNKRILNEHLNRIREEGDYYRYTVSSYNYEKNQSKFVCVDSSRLVWNNIEKFCFFAYDISELVRKRDENEELNRLMTHIIDNLPVSIYVKDGANELRFMYWNKACEKTTGVSSKDVYGKKSEEVCVNQFCNKIFGYYDSEALQTNREIKVQEPYTDKDGNIFIMQLDKFLVPVKNRPPFVVSTGYDLSKINNVKKELIDTRIAVEKASRKKTDFLQKITHEVRTPLNAIVGFTQLSDKINVYKNKEYYSIIHHNIHRLQTIFDNISVIYNFEYGETNINAENFLLLEIFEYEFNEYKEHPLLQAELIMDPVDEHLMAYGNCNYIAMVLDNLISNAIKFTPNGEIHIGYQVKEDYIVCYVKDSGIGVPEDEKDNIFNKFSQVNSFHEGIGLGLPICRLIIQEMGGDINFSSQEGKGSTFWFTLPAKENPSKKKMEV